MATQTPNLPASAAGPIQTGFGDLHIGLAIAGSATNCGSGVLTLNGKTRAGTNQIVKFLASALVAGGSVACIPLVLHFRFMDGATQLAGAFSTSLDGVSDCATVSRVVDASGYTRLNAYDVFINGATIYFGPTSDGGADCVLDYFITYGRASGGGAAV